MLPQGMKTAILDFVEGKVSKVMGKVSHIADVRHVAKLHKIEDVSEADADVVPNPAELANRPSEFQQSRMVLASEMKVLAPDLDPWLEAERGLDRLSDLDEDTRMKTFILNEMELCYGSSSVAAINPVWDQRRLDSLLKEFNKVKTQLEDYLDAVAYKLRRRQLIKQRKQVSVLGTTMGTWGRERYGSKVVKVDAITFWVDRLAELYRKIVEAQEVALSKPIPSAFITFNSRATQAHASGSLHHHSEADWVIQAAPEPRDVIWENLRMRAWLVGILSMFSWAVYIVVLIFYAAPVVFVQGLVNVNTLGEVSQGLYNFVNAPFVKQILESILPCVVMVLVLFPIPYFLMFTCYASGFVSRSEIDLGVFTRFFGFQIFTVFIYNMLAGSIINQWQDIINNPSSLVQTLSIAIPQTATFFICYVITSGIAKSAVRFMRLGSLTVFLLLSRAASTPRARARMWTPESRWYGGLVPWHTMVFFLGLMYSVINPIMCPTALASILITFICEKYTSLYTYQAPYESSGKIWSLVSTSYTQTALETLKR